MSIKLPFFYDGYIPPAGKDITVRSVPQYPFANRQIPDTTSRLYERTYLINPGTYTPRMAERSSGAPDTDPDQASAYLCEETNPPEIYNPTRGLVRRKFAHIPSDQVSYTSEFFSRPPLHDIKVGSVYAVSFDDLVTSHLFFARTAVSVVGAITQPTTTVAVAAEDFGELPATAFTIYDSGGNSTSPNLNSGATSIQSTLAGALAALDSVAVSSVPGSLTISWVGIVKSIGTTATGVTMTGGAGLNGSVTFTAARAEVSDTQSPATPTAVRVLTTGASHGGGAGQWLALWNEDKLVATVKAIAATGSSITVAAADGPLAMGSVAITHCAFAPAGLRVVNGTKECTIKATESFYLPGVTSGITTGADVPGVETYTDPIAWLGRLTASSLTSVTATASNDRLGKTSHGLATGDTFWLSVIGSGAGGLAIMTQYWAIRVDANNFQAAASAADAKAGTAIGISSDGTDLTVIVPTAWPALRATELASWMGPILSRTVRAVQMADALETRSAAA